MAFAAGWSPCVGPILASILLYASQRGRSDPLGGLLLAAYSIGLALPFLAAGLFFDRSRPSWPGSSGMRGGSASLSGVLLVALGAVMALGRLSSISSLSARSGAALAAAIAESPAVASWAAAGLWTLIAAAILTLPALRGRRIFSPARTALSAIFLLFALGDIVGLWSTARLVALWLSYQGV